MAEGGHEHQMAAGQGDVCGDPGPLGAQRFLGNLNREFLVLGDQFLDPGPGGQIGFFICEGTGWTFLPVFQEDFLSLQGRFQIRNVEEGSPVDAEVSLALVDLATLSLAEPNTGPIVDHFYGEEGIAVRTSLPLTLLEERLLHLRRLVLLGTAIAAAVGLALSGFLAPRFTRPLRAMATRAEAIARGAYSQRVAVASRDELGQLSVAFNSMSE